MARRVNHTRNLLGLVLGVLGGALLFGVIAIRDAEIAIRKGPFAPARWLNRQHLCNAKMPVAF
jgi:hypothetical protein